jgi:hypothetical protein
MKHIIIYKDDGAYSCFPAVIRSNENTLWVSFRRAGGFSLQAVRQGKYDHVDKGARIAVSKSSDNGESWNTEIIPPFDPERGEQDPSITQLSNGDLMINFFQWFVVPEEEKDRLKYPARQQIDGSWSDVEGPFVIRSKDMGKSWERELTYVDPTPLMRGGTSDAVLELPNGDLLMGIYGADYGGKVCRSYAVRSEDGGKTWGSPAPIAVDPEKRISFEEPGISFTPDGNLIAMIRSGEPGKYQYLYRVFSTDGGQSWSDLEETPMWGHPASVLLLDDGRMLCSYGYRREPFGIRACLSYDGGKTWDIDNEFVLRDDGGSRDLGYPCTVQLADSSLLTVYYIHGEDGIRHIAGTFWDC